MTTLSMLRFSTLGGAAAALDEVRALTATSRLAARSFATMSWESGRLLPDVQRADAPPSLARLGRGFWSLLLSHFFLPIAAGVTRHVNGYLLAALGTRDDCLRTSRERLTPGTSALFVVTDDANVHPDLRLLAGLSIAVTSTNLSRQQLEALRTAYQRSQSDVPLECSYTSRFEDAPGGKR